MGMSTTVRSTTGTAPIIITRISPDKVFIQTEDGAAQEYWVTEIRAAIEGETK
ncbi:hypothetical protein M2428_000109 [Arthrobacter sp. ES3-54]|nr:hypothetical protein [Arthrobacter sp. ES3-54]